MNVRSILKNFQLFMLLLLLFFPIISFANEQNWSLMTSMPSSRTEVVAISHDNLIFVIGGVDTGGKTLDTIEVYNVEDNSWENSIELPIPLHHTSAVEYENKLYVIGGYTLGWEPSSSLFVYDLFGLSLIHI